MIPLCNQMNTERNGSFVHWFYLFSVRTIFFFLWSSFIFSSQTHHSRFPLPEPAALVSDLTINACDLTVHLSLKMTGRGVSHELRLYWYFQKLYTYLHIAASLYSVLGWLHFKMSWWQRFIYWCLVLLFSHTKVFIKSFTFILLSSKGGKFLCQGKN